MSATRICTKCFTEKPVEEFGWKSMARGKRHAICKECTAIRSNNWYYQNKEAHIENVMAHKKEARQEAREYVWAYLAAHPCIGCGETDPVVLEFHHRSGKEREVSRMVADGLSIATIQEEINKCDVLCANCHRRLTSQNRGWFRK
jgi:hypothetical protein